MSKSAYPKWVVVQSMGKYHVMPCNELGNLDPTHVPSHVCKCEPKAMGEILVHSRPQ